MVRLKDLNNSGANAMSDFSMQKNDLITRTKSRKFFVSLLVGACFAMAMTLPSCPGQQAMQQQIDALQTTQQELAAKVRAMEAQVKGSSAGSEEQKKMMGDLAGAVTMQKTAIDNLNASVQQLDAKVAALSSSKSGGKSTAKSAPAKSSSKRKH
jgi:outer membrane murein-binding lipoprotein Lpp